MDLPTVPSYGPYPAMQQQRNIFPVVPHAGQEFYKLFLKGQPKLFGVVQITLVSLQLSMGAIVTVCLEYFNSTTASSGITYWASVLYLIAGVVSYFAEIKPSRTLVKGSLTFSMFSCVISFIEFCLICEDLTYSDCYYGYCGFYEYTVRNIAYAFLFVATVVQFCISVYLSIYGWRSLKQKFDYTPQMCVINNEYRYVMSNGSSQPTSEYGNIILGKTSVLEVS